MRGVRLFILCSGLIVLIATLTLVLSRRGTLEPQWVIVLTRRAGNEWFLVKILPDGSTIERPTMLQGQLHWSPDDEWVLYVELAHGGVRQLMRARPDGQQKQLLIQDVASVPNGNNWATDGEWIYYTFGILSADRDLARLNLNDRQQCMIHPSGNDFCCQWSPDGEWLLVDRGDSINRVRPDNRDSREIVEIQGMDLAYPQYGLDGQVIVFSAYEVPRTSVLYRVDVDGASMQQISHSDYSFLPSVSPDGRQVAYLATQLDTFLTHLYKIDLDNPVPQRLAELTNYFYDYNPFVSNLIWSPDGAFITFLAIHNERQGLFRIAAHGGAVETVYQVDGRATTPHFLPFPDKAFEGWVGLLIGCVAMSLGWVTALKVQGQGIGDGG